MKGVATSADGVPIIYEAEGSGWPALVLVHGWSCDRSYWREQVARFAASHQVVTVDLAGHGESGVGRDAWTMQAFGEDVAVVVEQLELGRAVLVGHSMGGDVVVETALRVPDRVAGLVWVDVYSRLGDPPPRDAIEAFVSPFRQDFAGRTHDFVRRMFPAGADPALVESVATDMASAPVEVAIPAMEQARGNHGALLERLPRVRPRIVAINSDLAQTDTESLRRYGVDVVLVRGVGHFPMLEDPDGFARALTEALARFEP